MEGNADLCPMKHAMEYKIPATKTCAALLWYFVGVTLTLQMTTYLILYTGAPNPLYLQE